jgi:hypothetical protein
VIRLSQWFITLGLWLYCIKTSPLHSMSMERSPMKLLWLPQKVTNGKLLVFLMLHMYMHVHFIPYPNLVEIRLTKTFSALYLQPTLCISVSADAEQKCLWKSNLNEILYPSTWHWIYILYALSIWCKSKFMSQNMHI